MPTSGQNLVIVGTDDNGLLHIRIFDPAGVRTDIFEQLNDNTSGVLSLVSEDASGTVLSDELESSLPATQAEALSALKQQLQSLSLGQSLTDAQKAQLLSEVTLIVGQTPSPSPAPTPAPPISGSSGTVTILVANPRSTNAGRTVTLTATVKNGGRARAIPTGVVTFLYGANPLGTVALRHGRARLRVSTLPIGRDPIQAAYAGNGDLGPSTSVVVLETIRAHRSRTEREKPAMMVFGREVERVPSSASRSARKLETFDQVTATPRTTSVDVIITRHTCSSEE